MQDKPITQQPRTGYKKQGFTQLFPYLLTGVFFLCVLWICLALMNRSYQRTLNGEVAAMAETIRQHYPDIPDTEIIRVLQEERTGEQTSELLARFGYTGNDFFWLQSASRYARNLRIMLVCWTCALLVAFFALTLLRNRKREKALYELIDYVRKINDRVYDLKIADNDEGTLSLLTNEIYKTSVLLKESAERSRAESENLSRALADISHQIKTPLTSVQIMLDNLHDHPEMEAETRQRFLREAVAQIDATTGLIVALLHLAKFDSGTIRMHPSLVCMGDLLNDAMESLSILAEVRDVTVICCGDTDAQISIDYKWEMEAYKNLIKNAVEHSPAGGKVMVSMEDTQLFLKVCVTDEGEGIAPEDLKHIFERFYKAQYSVTVSENVRAVNDTTGTGRNREKAGAMDEGTPSCTEKTETENRRAENGQSARNLNFGIGLSFAKTIIEQDGGFITADSVPGQGTTFTVRYKK